MYVLLIICIIVAVISLIIIPHFWLNHVLRKHHKHNDQFPGNGGQFAQHLIKRLKLQNIQVQVSDQGDHYDPIDKCVRLTPDKFEGKSLTSLVVAAHEVGHAIQDADGYRPFIWRHYLAKGAILSEKAGVLVFMLIPLLTLLTRSPMVSLFSFIAAFAILGISVFVHLITLPVEWDASFNRALPLLFKGNYIKESEHRAAKSILRAAALTYVASSLMSALNFSRWIAILRR